MLNTVGERIERRNQIIEDNSRHSLCVDKYSHFVSKLTHADRRINLQMGDGVMSSKSKKLLDQERETISLKHYSKKTEKTYISQIRRFILFHVKRH